jgi:cytochrome c-type biogenesis protein
MRIDMLCTFSLRTYQAINAKLYLDYDCSALVLFRYLTEVFFRMDISHGLSFSALLFSLLMGLVSFVSPCILPLIPSYVSYITGISFDELVGRESRTKHIRMTLLHSVAFVLGFSLVFVLLGATASFAGRLMTEYVNVIRVVGGALLIILWLFVAGVARIPFLQYEAKLHLKTRPAGYAGTLLVGVIFGAGWTPCTGPFLGAALLQAAQTETVGTGMTLLAFYSLGLGIPFILSAVAISTFLSSFSKLKEHFKAIKVTSGVILMAMGLLLVTNKMTLLTSYTLMFWEKIKGI